MKKTSLTDIANQLGVSKTLVSMVLNNRATENGISEETQRRVLELAEKLNYKPNQIARGLRLGKSHTIGLIVSDISNIFFAKIGRSVEDKAGSCGYNVIFSSSDENSQKESQLLQVMKDRRVDGLIISSTQVNKNEILELKNENYPFVLIDRYFTDIDTNYVVADNFEGSYQAVNHLIKLGHRKIGHITVFPDHVQCMQERLSGYKKALEDNGIEFNPYLVKDISWGNMKENVEMSLRELLKPPYSVSALFVTNNRLTINSIDCINNLRLRIPQDLALVSFDDIDLFRLSYPPITAVAQNEERIGAEAVKILLEEINQKGKVLPKKHILLPTKLNVRRSCGSFMQMS